MQIADFNESHIEQATIIAKENYQEERVQVPILPPINTLPELNHFADNNLGVAAFEDGRMLGFLCCYRPFEDAFRTTGVKGTFSPLHAHAVVRENRERIYKHLYQAVAEKWVRIGIKSHAIALYAHDKQAINSFFINGFGSRTMEAIRPMEKIKCNSTPGYSFLELESEQKADTLELKNLLIDHLGNTPIFMSVPYMDKNDLEAQYERRKPRYFVAQYEGQVIAWIETTDGGENFAGDDSSVQNICGAYCLSEHRGRDVFQNLLNCAIESLKNDGYLSLSVDFECFNPTAYGFWLKYFNPYVHSVVRRIDDKIFKENINK